MTNGDIAIPKGYQVQITSWENDGDHYKSNSENGLSKIEAQFLVDFFGKFKSVNDRKNPGLGNQIVYNEELILALASTILKYPEIFDYQISEKFKYFKDCFDYRSSLESIEEAYDRLVEDEPEDEHGDCILSELYDTVLDFVYEILGSPVDYEWGFCRVCEKIEVFYLPDFVVFHNVSDQFVSIDFDK